jgi:hypothetical protein
LSPHEKAQGEDEEDDEEDDLTDEGMMENVLFFNQADPFEQPDLPPIVKYQIKQNKLGLTTGHFQIIVTPDMYRKVIQDFQLKRDRPEHAKDWNELVKPKTNNMPKFG